MYQRPQKVAQKAKELDIPIKFSRKTGILTARLNAKTVVTLIDDIAAIWLADRELLVSIVGWNRRTNQRMTVKFKFEPMVR